jgi:hypothetical protein
VQQQSREFAYAPYPLPATCFIIIRSARERGLIAVNVAIDTPPAPTTTWRVTGTGTKQRFP